MAEGILYSVSLIGDNNDWNTYTLILRFATAALTLPSGAITKVRFTIEAGSTEAITIANSYVGHRAGSGDVYDFATTPVPLLWAGSASKVISAGASAVTDWATFSYDKTTDLLFTLYCNGGAGSDMFRSLTLPANVFSYYKAANDAATVDKTGYIAYTLLLGVNKIEYQTEDAGGNFFAFF